MDERWITAPHFYHISSSDDDDDALEDHGIHDVNGVRGDDDRSGVAAVVRGGGGDDDRSEAAAVVRGGGGDDDRSVVAAVVRGGGGDGVHARPGAGLRIFRTSPDPRDVVATFC
ncbi:uncharacterized protein DMAD_05189 [Drosophila madeirensis]|uniref:Uncharacterized protein n=1 Tax=Drosophila madeirensis TaxID=30013 RepID=A0AAU9FKX3_DROMD